MADRGNGAANIAVLLAVCGLDAISRSGPLGQVFACGAGCVMFVIGVIVLIVYLSNTDFSDASDGGTDASGYPNSSSVSHHTPTETTTETFWSNFIFITLLLLVLSMPVFYYVPVYIRGPNRGPVKGTQSTLAQRGVERPMLALSIADAPSGGERV